MKIVAAFDHRGVHLKEAVLAALEGHEVLDLGTDSDVVRIDYPDKARELAEAIQDGRAERGILVCGSGVGASIAACKLTGIRAAICHDVYSAHQGVEHDDMNVLCLGSEIVGPSLARDLIAAFLNAKFDGGERYVARLRKVEELERMMKRGGVTPAGAGGTRPVRLDRQPRARGARGGQARRMMTKDAVTGVTSNPTIFQKAIAAGGAYDEQLLEVAKTESDPKEIFLQLSAQDIAEACELLEPVWKRTDGLDGFVSWEVDPTLAYDRESTFEEMIRLHEWIDRPNLYVKIPATKPGLGAIEDAVARGKNINVTLIFSLRRHQEVMEAYLRGLERLVAAGKSPAKVQSVASFFVSRVDTEADKRLDAAGKPALKGKLAVANARLAYQNYLEAFSGPRWEFLESKGANVQRPLWASTSVKNPEYRDVMYVEELIGPNTVNTMPDETIEAFQDHGEVRGDTILDGVDEAHKLFEDLAAAGVDYDDVSLTLEEEGVQKFADSFAELLDGIRAKRDELVAA